MVSDPLAKAQGSPFLTSDFSGCPSPVHQAMSRLVFLQSFYPPIPFLPTSDLPSLLKAMFEVNLLRVESPFPLLIDGSPPCARPFFLPFTFIPDLLHVQVYLFSAASSLDQMGCEPVLLFLRCLMPLFHCSRPWKSEPAAAASLFFFRASPLFLLILKLLPGSLLTVTGQFDFSCLPPIFRSESPGSSTKRRCRAPSASDVALFPNLKRAICQPVPVPLSPLLALLLLFFTLLFCRPSPYLLERWHNEKPFFFFPRPIPPPSFPPFTRTAASVPFFSSSFFFSPISALDPRDPRFSLHPFGSSPHGST